MESSQDERNDQQIERQDDDLATARGRKRYLDQARPIANSTDGGPCPRCGKHLDRKLFEIDAALAFRERSWCTCVFVAFERDAKERERRWRREKERYRLKSELDAYRVDRFE